MRRTRADNFAGHHRRYDDGSSEAERLIRVFPPVPRVMEYYITRVHECEHTNMYNARIRRFRRGRRAKPISSEICRCAWVWMRECGRVHICVCVCHVPSMIQRDDQPERIALSNLRNVIKGPPRRGQYPRMRLCVNRINKHPSYRVFGSHGAAAA